jgi:TatD DNase family protein
MILVDSHCHLDCLDLTKYHNDLGSLLKNAEDAGVGFFLCVCITQSAFPEMLNAVTNFSNVFVTVGTHPNEKVSQEPTIDEILQLADQPKVIGIGETGLDYYRSQGDIEWQRSRFRNHIRAAKEIGKPIIVHSRSAREDTIKILKEEGAEKVGGILHCFTENWEMAQQAMDLNFYISFSGIITFHNAQELQEVAKKVPLDRILIETDSPYLAPMPFRGQSNEPAYVYYVAQKLAELKKVDINTIAEKTTRNFFDLFIVH